MIDLIHKPVGSKTTRPVWATNDKQLMEKCLTKREMLRFKIAQMYWRQNMTAKDIATSLDMTEGAVKMILSRLKNK